MKGSGMVKLLPSQTATQEVLSLNLGNVFKIYFSFQGFPSKYSKRLNSEHTKRKQC